MLNGKGQELGGKEQGREIEEGKQRGRERGRKGGWKEGLVSCSRAITPPHLLLIIAFIPAMFGDAMGLTGNPSLGAMCTKRCLEMVAGNRECLSLALHEQHLAFSIPFCSLMAMMDSQLQAHQREVSIPGKDS